jgi:NDP-sugar pyrophosphorylase family protein
MIGYIGYARRVLPMKAVILAGGEGTRLRPLTLSLPKPVVPVVDRPFLRHQIDLLKSVGITQIIFSVAYQPDRVRSVFGDGTQDGVRIHYAIEDSPLGTGGAVKNAETLLDERTIVFNGDVLTDVDLPSVIKTHISTGAAATIVLTPVANPSAYGLVETDATGRVVRFVEKPDPSQITTDTINAGIYLLETRVLDLMPKGEKHSIERAFFPNLLRRGDLVRAHIHRGYWIDIGTPEKYAQVHRDILSQRFRVRLDGAESDGGWIHPLASVSPEATLVAPFYVGPGTVVAERACVGPNAVLVRGAHVAVGATVTETVAWDGVSLGQDSNVEACLLGPSVRVEENAVARGLVLGEGSVLSAHSRPV